MAKRKDQIKSDEIIPDDSDEGSPPPQKKPKKETVEDELSKRGVSGVKAENGETDGVSKNADGEAFWELGNSRRVTVRKYKKTILIDVREFWEDKDGQMKPGKKGISLNPAQWEGLKSHLSGIDKHVAELKE